MFRTIVILAALCSFLVGDTLATAKQVTLRFAGRWAPGVHAPYDTLAKYMAEYTKLNPHITFEYIGEAGHTQYLEKLLVMGSATGLPDIVHLYNVWMPDLAHKGMLAAMPAPVAERMKREIYPVALASTTYRGQILGVPTENQVSALAYNQRLLAEAGVQVPTTWAALLRDAERLARFTPTGALERSGLSLDGGGWGWTAHFITLLTGDGGQFIDNEGVVRFHEEAGLAVLDRIVDWFAVRRFANNGSGLFAQGKGAFALAFPWWWSGMKKTLPDSHEVAVTLIPPGQVRQVAFQYGWGFYVAATSSQADEAWQFLEWLSSRMGREVSPLGETLATLGSLPVNRQDLRSAVFAADARIYEGFIENLNMAVQEPMYPEGERRQAIFGTEITRAINKEKTPAQALADAARQIQAILDQYR